MPDCRFQTSSKDLNDIGLIKLDCSRTEEKGINQIFIALAVLLAITLDFNLATT